MKSLALTIAVVLVCLLQTKVQAQTSPLKKGDPITIELKVPAEDAQNVSSSYTISERGTLKMPYLNQEISAAGLSTTELARRIEGAYRAAEIYTSPTINIVINDPSKAAPHIVSVGGEVRSPTGTVPLRDNMRLYQAIMSCGGPTEFANMRKVKIIRGTRQFVFDMKKLLPDGSNNPLLEDGDTIHIPIN